MIFLAYRSFILSRDASTVVDGAAETRPRIYDEMQGVEWVLVRSPEKGVPVIPGFYVYVNAKATIKASTIVLLYSYDERTVEVQRIWIS